MMEVVNVYRFKRLADPRDFGERWLGRARELGLLGTLLVAEEGANVAVAGESAAVDRFVAELLPELGAEPSDVKRMPCDEVPFGRLILKVKREIVTAGWEADPADNDGTFLSPEEWHRLAARPDVVLVDTRNLYESNVGSFRGALRPAIDSFRELPRVVEELAPHRERTVLTFCTGGIRCEKAVPLFKRAGFQNVFQLHGGILNYLKHYPDGLWEGECFVFDERVSVTGQLTRGSYTLCPRCGQARSDDGCTNCDAEL